MPDVLKTIIQAGVLPKLCCTRYEVSQKETFDDDGACPYFWPVGTKEQRQHFMLNFRQMAGGTYMLGG